MLAALRLGSDDVLARFEAHRPLADRTARRFARHLPPGTGLDDLTQECAVALYRAAAKFDPDRGTPFEGYAGVVVARAARAYLRRESRRGLSGLSRAPGRPAVGFQPYAVNEDGAGVPTVELVADRGVWRPGWDRAEWERVLACLSERQRQVVTLRLLHHLTTREVGRALGFRASRVTFLWQQALERMQNHVSRGCDCCGRD